MKGRLGIRDSQVRDFDTFMKDYALKYDAACQDLRSGRMSQGEYSCLRRSFDSVLNGIRAFAEAVQAAKSVGDVEAQRAIVLRALADFQAASAVNYRQGCTSAMDVTPEKLEFAGLTPERSFRITNRGNNDINYSVSELPVSFVPSPSPAGRLGKGDTVSISIFRTIVPPPAVRPIKFHVRNNFLDDVTIEIAVDEENAHLWNGLAKHASQIASSQNRTTPSKQDALLALEATLKDSPNVSAGEKGVMASSVAKTKEVKDRVMLEMAKLVEELNCRLGKTLEHACVAGRKLRRHAKVAHQKLFRLQQTMNDLLPQIRHWLRTGRVAAGKILNLHIPELYSIVRGKVGKAVEFGLSWGITRLRGGFVLATVARDREDLHDSTFAVRAVEDLAALFGKAPRWYAYDRAGHSEKNIARLRNLGVRNIGLAPRGQTAWAVKGQVKHELIRERTLVEGSIGTIKRQRYGFNHPAARSAAMMGVCGQRAALGFNLGKLVRGIAQKRRLDVVW